MTSTEHAESNAIGIAKRGENVITMHPNIPLENAQDTLLHEAMHFLWVDMMPGAQEALEERCVSLLATGLVNLFHRNPRLVDWLMLAR